MLYELMKLNNESERVYPEWFINELVNEEYKKKDKCDISKSTDKG